MKEMNWNVKEQESTIALKEMYEEVKNLQVISYKNQEEIDANIYFAEIEIANAGTVSNNGLQISVQDFNVKVEDTLLFVENEKQWNLHQLRKYSPVLIYMFKWRVFRGKNHRYRAVFQFRRHDEKHDE